MIGWFHVPWIFVFAREEFCFPPPQWSIRNLIHPAKWIFSSFFFPSFRQKCHMSLVENGSIFLSIADSSHDTKAPKMINQEALLYCDLILSESLLCKKWSPIFWTWQMLCLIWCIWVLVFDDVQVLYSSFFFKKLFIVTLLSSVIVMHKLHENFGVNDALMCLGKYIEAIDMSNDKFLWSLFSCHDWYYDTHARCIVWEVGHDMIAN